MQATAGKVGTAQAARQGIDAPQSTAVSAAAEADPFGFLGQVSQIRSLQRFSASMAHDKDRCHDQC